MKNLLYLFLFILTDCHKNEKSIEEEKQKRYHTISFNILKGEEEKILLLSEIKGMPYDTVYSILLDYYYKTEEDTSCLKYKNAISWTCNRHKYSKQKISTIIYNFQFGELLQSDIEDFNATRQEPEPEDPY